MKVMLHLWYRGKFLEMMSQCDAASSRIVFVFFGYISVKYMQRSLANLLLLLTAFTEEDSGDIHSKFCYNICHGLKFTTI